jgi:hypothetical protein
MRLSAGGAPVAVKSRAVNRSTNPRTSLYIHIYFVTFPDWKLKSVDIQTWRGEEI